MATTSADDGARPRILVVEDESAVCDLLEDILEDEGYAPHCARTDKAAYETLDRDWASFAALVVDVNLGLGTTGFDVARYARRLNPQVAVVYTSGGTPESVARHGVEDGVLVAKPFDRDLLVSTLRDKLGR